MLTALPWTCHAKPAATGQTCGHKNSGRARHYGLIVCASCGCTKTASDARKPKTV